MQKRNFNRIHLKLQTRFFCCNTFYSGTVINFSENGMLIQTKIRFPFEWKFEVIILVKEKIIKVPVKIIRLIRNNGSYDTMAVGILGLPKDYKEFIDSIGNFSKSDIISTGRKRKKEYINKSGRVQKQGRSLHLI